MLEHKPPGRQTRLVKVYKYGLLPPTMGGDLVDAQLTAAHQYYNVLIDIERTARERRDGILAGHPLVIDASAALEIAEEAWDEHRRRAENDRGLPDDPAHGRKAQALRTALGQARRALVQARLMARADLAVVDTFDAASTVARARRKAARAACGLYWGTYLQIERDVDAACRRQSEELRFRRWTGEGAVAVQCQGGLPVARLFGRDRRIQIDDLAQPVPGRSGKPRPRLRLRVGSTSKHRPVWAEWPLILHRPLPATGKVKWATVVRRRRHSRDEWSLHLTIECPCDEAPPGASGTVAVDLRWSGDESAPCVASWTDGDQSGEVFLDPAVVGMLRKAADLRAIRDRALDSLRGTLGDWCRNHGELDATHEAAVRGLAQSGSAARFVALAHWWREHRCAGDTAWLAQLETWRKRDKHLWLWEVNARRRAIARRREQYRVWAAGLASAYRTLVVERIDLSALARRREDAHATRYGKGRYKRVVAAPSELRSALIRAFHARGRLVVSVAPAPNPASMLEAHARNSGVKSILATANVGRFIRGDIEPAVAETLA